MNESVVLEQRRQARAAKHLADSALLDLHRKAANALLAAGDGAQVRERALQQVEKWHRQHLCNPRYVQAWRNILDLPPRINSCSHVARGCGRHRAAPELPLSASCLAKPPPHEP